MGRGRSFWRDAEGPSTAVLEVYLELALLNVTPSSSNIIDIFSQESRMFRLNGRPYVVFEHISVTLVVDRPLPGNVWVLNVFQVVPLKVLLIRHSIGFNNYFCTLLTFFCRLYWV